MNTPLRLTGLGPPLVWAVVFAVAHTQSPLYFSNQNQYFLHGLAAGGRGDLDQDWLANTSDPTPVFSAAVAVAYRAFGEWPLQASYFVLLGVYFVSLMALVSALPGGPRGRLGQFAFLIVLVALHAAIVRVASIWLTGEDSWYFTSGVADLLSRVGIGRVIDVDYPWYFQCGVAGQYVLGPGLQPSAFGTLLLASLAAFAHRRPVLAVVCSSAAAILHPTYLLSAAALTLAYMHVLWHEGQRRASVWLGAAALAAALPVAITSAVTFAPTSPDVFAEAQHLLVDLRIPHHAVVSRWLDATAWGQIAWVGLALLLVRGTRLFPLLAIPAAISVALTLVQVATGNRTLALLFPWRISATLVPVATAVILARAVSAVAARLERGPRPLWVAAVAACVAVLVAVTAGGVAVRVGGLGYRMNDEELAVMQYVDENRRRGDTYLIPVSVPKLGAGPRGSISTTFTPPPRPKPGANLIPVDFLRFRLMAGAPIFVDFKSIPYKDVDVLEWYRRLELCERWYKANDWDRVRDELVREGVTHVVTTADRPATGSALEREYGDEFYHVYRVQPGSNRRGRVEDGGS